LFVPLFKPLLFLVRLCVFPSNMSRRATRRRRKKGAHLSIHTTAGRPPENLQRQAESRERTTRNAQRVHVRHVQLSGTWHPTEH
jgi:hypothetical protein